MCLIVAAVSTGKRRRRRGPSAGQTGWSGCCDLGADVLASVGGIEKKAWELYRKHMRGGKGVG